MYVRIRAHEDHARSRRPGPYLDEQVEPGGAGQPEIRQHEIKADGSDQHQRIVHAACRLDLVTEPGQEAREQPADGRLVVDQQDATRRMGLHGGRELVIHRWSASRDCNRHPGTVPHLQVWNDFTSTTKLLYRSEKGAGRVQIHVASADNDPHPLPGNVSGAGEQPSERGRPGWLDDDLQPFP